MPNLSGQIPADRFADPDEGKRWGKKPEPTWDQALARDWYRCEVELHGSLMDFLNRIGDQIALVVHTNPARRSRATVGMPDFIIHFMNGRSLFIELKIGKNKLSPEQDKIITKLKTAQFEVLITGSYEEATNKCLSMLSFP